MIPVLNSLCGISFNLADLIKFDCSKLLASFNQATKQSLYDDQRKKMEHFNCLQMYDNEFAVQTGKIRQTYLYKEIVKKKLGLIQRVNLGIVMLYYGG